MAKIDVRCPICSKWDKIEIADNVTKNVTKGLLALNITAGMICEHSFIVYVDKNLIVRDTFIADFKIETTETSIAQEAEESPNYETETIKFELVKLNIPEILMAYVFKSAFLGDKILIISEDEYLDTHVVKFFKYIMHGFFEIDITTISNENYRDNRKRYKDYIVFKNREIVQDKNKLINPKKLNIEKSIAKKFTSELELVPSLIILRNEIQKVFEFSKTIAEFIKHRENKPISSKLLIDYIEEKYGETIQMPLLRLLIEIVKSYFKVEIPKIDGVTDFLGFL
ncbi:MAG: hypothetical protein ACFFB0_20045 [Promethearchaeota archaeon]